MTQAVLHVRVAATNAPHVPTLLLVLPVPKPGNPTPPSNVNARTAITMSSTKLFAVPVPQFANFAQINRPAPNVTPPTILDHSSITAAFAALDTTMPLPSLRQTMSASFVLLAAKPAFQKQTVYLATSTTSGSTMKPPFYAIVLTDISMTEAIHLALLALMTV